MLAAIAERMERWASAPPGQDADRLLQRREAPGRPRAHLVHLPRVHLPGTEGRREERGVLHRFLPAMSTEALKAKGADSAHADPSSHHLTLDDLARWLNPIVAGWMNYYGRFYRSAMYPLLLRVNTYLRRWAGKKYRRLRTYKRFQRWWTGLIDRQPGLFAHWQVGPL